MPTSSNGTTFGPGSNNNLLKSNGTSVYWTTLVASDIPTLSITDKTSGTLPVTRGGTGVTTIANIQAGKDGDGNTITSKYVTVDTAQTITGTKSWGSGGAGGQLNGAATNGGINSIKIGDDVWLGDCNTGGIMGMKSTGANCGFYMYNSSGTQIGKLYFDGTNLVCDKNINANIIGNAATATKATQDGSGNTITSTYLKINTAEGIASCSGNGQNWYYKIATIKITSTYINRPIVFEISGRGLHFSLLQVIFNNANNSDPGLSSFTTNNNSLFWIKKTTTSTWEIYGKYDEQWGFACIHRITGTGANIGITVNMTNAGTEDSIISEATRALYITPLSNGTGASGTWGISISGNAATATKATQDADGNTISSTYLKLSGGFLTGSLSLTGDLGLTGDLALSGDLIISNSSFSLSLINDRYSGRQGLKSSGYGKYTDGIGMVWTEIESWLVYRDAYGNIILNGDCTGNAANVTGTVAVSHGGTGATTAAGARTNIGAAAASDVTHVYINTGLIGHPLDTSSYVISFETVGKNVYITFRGESRAHAEDEVFLVIPAGYRSGGDRYFPAAINNTACGVVMRSNGNVSIYTTNPSSGRLYLSMSYCIE